MTVNVSEPAEACVLKVVDVVLVAPLKAAPAGVLVRLHHTEPMTPVEVTLAGRLVCPWLT